MIRSASGFGSEAACTAESGDLYISAAALHAAGARRTRAGQALPASTRLRSPNAAKTARAWGLATRGVAVIDIDGGA